MLNLIYLLYEFLVNSSFEFVLYVLVDVITKSSLKEVKDNDLEKRQIWLYESLVLVFAALLVYLFHHTPYILIGLSVFTLIYTQLLGRVDFRFWWLQFRTRWDEFQQHEESMEHYHELQNRKATVVPNVVATQSGWMPPTVTAASSGFTFDPNSVEPWYPSDNGNMIGHNVPNVPNNMPPNVTPTSYLRQRFAGSPDFQAPQPIYSSSPIISNRNSLPRPQTELLRKPLHTYLPSPIRHNKPETSSGNGFPSVLKNKVMSVFGMSQSEPLPPGLPNKGQNICFLNSVLQCLAQTPKLSMYMKRDAGALKCGKDQAALVSFTADLIFNLCKPVDVDGRRVLNHASLRDAASRLRGSVVVGPKFGGQQRQQDSAEFLMWFLDSLHNALNSCAPTAAGNNNTEIQSNYQNVTLQLLKFVYGDLSPLRIVQAKKACRVEIEAANSLDSDTYAEPIQRLSDLEWLTYKEKNNSIIDDLFAGQLVESQRCVACNRISVSIQPFSILPVPIVEPRQLNGLVYLEDCFTKFGTTEDLFGPEGLRCECCNRNSNSNNIPVGSNNVNSQFAAVSSAEALSASPVLPNGEVADKDFSNLRKRIAQMDSGLTSSPVPNINVPRPTAAMSPIPSTGEALNDSGFQDNQMRTSTPIHSTGLQLKLTDGQRRSLLRQLPECLIVQLMRFSQYFGELRKLRKPVSIPLNGLDLTNLIIDNVMHREDMAATHTSYRYDLYGVCVHLGGDSMSGGHYIAFAKVSNGQWYKFDDESVVAVNMEYELTTKLVRENAYLLFYRHCAYQ